MSLQSLKAQTDTNFKVVFVDYGSTEIYAKKVYDIVTSFDFCNYFYVGHSGLLWNKSKALNFGIRKTDTEYIITADVDVVFSPKFINETHLLKSPKAYSLFKIGYLSEDVTNRLTNTSNLDKIVTTHVGNTFGIGLYPTSVLEKIGGLDEFFHFYGSEDEDLNFRVQSMELKLIMSDKLMLFHQWHKRYPQRKDNNLTVEPRLKNIQRINQRHFLQNKETLNNFPNDNNWGCCFEKEELENLKKVEVVVKLNNIASHVIHFLEEELPKQFKGIVEVIFEKDKYYNSIKYKIKKILGKQSQTYLEMKAINDLVLLKIVFRYRHYNYSYKVSKNLKRLIFTIDLNSF
jgi:glycosyltransferase involved in cell wall biosynthesis